MFTVHLLSAVFFQFYLEEWQAMDVQTRLDMLKRLKIVVKLLLSTDRNSYIPCRLAQQRVTLSDLEWLFPQRTL